MANYEVNLKLALDGAEKAAQKIKELRKNTKELDKDINRFNRAVDKRMGKKKGEGSFVFSFKNLSKEVNTARNALNKAAIGTEEFNKAVEFDKQIRVRNKILRGTPYLHKSRKPLGEINFDEKENEQLDLFNEECEGMCGV